MANPAWPTSLPGPVLESMSWKPQNNTIRSQMETGVAKVRRRFTNVPEDFNCMLMLTSAQLQTLFDFHDITLATVLPFDWYEWRKPNDTTLVAAYRFKRRPEHVPWGQDHWQVTLELEQLTTFQGATL